MIKKLIFLTLLGISTLYSQTKTYDSFHKTLQEDLQSAEMLSNESFFKPYLSELDGLQKCLKAFEKEMPVNRELQTLRLCEKKSKKFDGHYVAALREVIAKNDAVLFEKLLEANPRILQKERWREKSVTFYKKIQDSHAFSAGEKLLASYEEEEGYRQSAAMLMADYESNVKVLSYENAKHSRDKNGKKRTFFVGYKKRNGVVTLVAENSNRYTVTLNIKIKKLKNYSLDRPKDYTVEIAPRSKQEIIHLRIKDRSKRSRVSWSYGWVMGSSRAHHDNSFLYGLPFKTNSRVIVSQGFNGKSTHTGSSKYAVDFVADVGTPLYAARGGMVVATESSFNKAGFDKSFGKYANYIVIEHVDKTMGKYYHLKQDGVNVTLGQYVSKGQFIGYSGNTGYSSGPHLHFGVYTISANQKSSVSLPVKFITNIGVVTAPKKGDVFKAVR